jgi:hypothetical protein
MAEKRFWRLGLCACTVIVLAACGSDDSDAETTTVPVVSTTATTETATTETSATTTVAETDAPAAPSATTAADQEPAPTPAADQAPAGDVDTCAILESLDPSALLGEPAGEAVGSGSDIFGFTCAIKSASEDARGATRLTIMTNSAAENFEKQKEIFGVDTEVAGLGDSAFHSGPYVFVLDGETFFYIQVIRDSSLGVAIDDAELEAAATKVLAALQA